MGMGIFAKPREVRDVHCERAESTGDTSEARKPQPSTLRPVYLTGLVEESAIAACFCRNPNSLYYVFSIHNIERDETRDFDIPYQ
jgi:hypothetical protein